MPDTCVGTFIYTRNELACLDIDINRLIKEVTS